MSFRKRNVVLSSAASSRIPNSQRPNVHPADPANPTITPSTASTTAFQPPSNPGIRPSVLDGRPVTSTGTPTLDSLLAGHGGLPLGTSLLIEETGTTDYAGTIARYYVAEGIVQCQTVHVVGLSEVWGKELPGCTGVYGGEEKAEVTETKGSKERMKIAWRYERLGEFGAGKAPRASPLPNRSPSINTSTTTTTATTPSPSSAYPPAFTHTFSLTQRLSLPPPPAPSPLLFYPLHPSSSPFTSILTALHNALSTPTPTSTSNSPPSTTTIHRLLLPNLLSPLLYLAPAPSPHTPFPPSPSHPSILLPFLHSLRSLLRQHPSRLSILITLPLSLHPRTTPLTRLIEILSDGVIELIPFDRTAALDTQAAPSTSSPSSSSSSSPPVAKSEEQPHGGVRVWKTPAWTERAGGSGTGVEGVGEMGDAGGEDLAFTVKKGGLVIGDMSLPPVEMDGPAPDGDGGSQQGRKGGGLEF